MRLSHDQIVGGALNLALASDDMPLLKAGFLKDEDGTLYIENVLEHETRQDESEISVSEPEKLEYVLTLDNAVFPMTHKLVNVGLGSYISNIYARIAISELPVAGKNIRIAINAMHKGKHLKNILKGSYTVPGRVHPLGHPEGRLGYMVQVYPKNLLFVTADGKISFQANMLEL